MSLIKSLWSLLQITHKVESDPASASDNHADDTPKYPLYFYNLDEVQRAIYRRPFGPDGFPIDAWTDPYYETWFFANKPTTEELRGQLSLEAEFTQHPLFSIIVPLYKTPLEYLQIMVDSVLNQTYRNIQLVLVNASPELAELSEAIERYRKLDERITVVALDRNYGITENTNRGLAVAKGDFCSFLDHDDFIEPNLFFEYAKALNENPSIDVFYCDEDLVRFDTNTGQFRYLHPMFKPQFSPELLLCKNYIVHLMTIRRSVIDEMPTPDSRYDGAQDYNMVLFCSAHGRKVHGVQKVLYHWRISDQSTAANPEAKPYSRRAYKLSASNQLDRENIDGSIIASGIINIHNIWLRDPSPSVSLIVDCCSSDDSIESFLSALRQNGENEIAEVILLTDEKNPSELPDLGKTCSASIAVYSTQLSNQGQRLNYGAKHAKGEILVFLDASCSFISPNPINQLSALVSLEGVGIASPKVLYRDGTTKSFGVAITPEKIMPLHRGYQDDFPAYQCNARAFQNVSACSLQGLTIKRSLFKKVSGFSEEYAGEIVAVDLCQRTRQNGARIVVSPTIKVEANESPQETLFDTSLQQPDYSLDDMIQFDKTWPNVRSKGDPYINSNLDQSSPFYQLPRS